MTVARNIWAAALLLAAGCAPANRSGPVAAGLIADVKSVAAGQPFTVALHLTPDRGWHLYWSNPGDSGLAPEVTWELPPGFAAGEIQRPFPEAIATPPFMTYGHEDDVFYLFTITPPKDLPPGNVTLAAKVEWLACKDVCLPGEALLELVLPTNPGPAQAHPRHAAKIAAARLRLPADSADWQFAAHFENGRYRMRATSLGASARAIVSATFFPYDPNVIRHAAPQTWRREGNGYLLELEPAQPSAPPPETLAGVLVSEQSWADTPSVRALRIEAPFAGDAPPAQQPRKENTMKRMLTIAAVLAALIPVAQAQVEIGAAAPAFTLPDTRGATHSLADFAGKVVVLEWTNPDCPFVKKHYGPKNMQGLQAKYTAQGVVWLSICSSAPGKQGHNSAADWNPILADQGSAATALLLDPDGTVGRAYGAKTTPHLFVIAADGTLAYDGAIDNKPTYNSEDIPGARGYLAEAMDALLAGQPVPLAKTQPYGCSVKY